MAFVRSLRTPFPARLRLSVAARLRSPLAGASSRVAPAATVVVLAAPSGAVPSALLCSTRSTPWLTVTAPAKVLFRVSLSRPVSVASTPLIRPPRPLIRPERTTLPAPLMVRLRAAGVSPDCRLRSRSRVSVLPAALRMTLLAVSVRLPLYVLLPRRLASAPPARVRARLRLRLRPAAGFRASVPPLLTLTPLVLPSAPARVMASVPLLTVVRPV